MTFYGLKRVLYEELIAGRTAFDYTFLLTGLTIQILVFYFAPSQPIMIVSGIAGIFSVVLCSQRKISTFVFGFLQVITYLIICYRQRLYGEVGINIFYFISMLYGVYAWKERYQHNTKTGETELQTRRLTPIYWITMIAFALFGSWLTGWSLQHFTDDSDPYLDAFTTIPAIIGQILMVLGFREQWFFWFCIDIACVWLWIRAGNWSMAALYAFWCVNCIYGFLHWSENSD